MELYQVTLPYACFGILIDSSNIIRNSAPIGKWMIGKSLDYIESWVRRKNGTIVKT